MDHSKLWVIIEFLECSSCHNLLDAGVVSEAHIAVIYQGLFLGLDYLHSGGAPHHEARVVHIPLEEDLELSGKSFERDRHLFLHLPHICTVNPSDIHLQVGACPTRTEPIPSHLNFVVSLLISHAVRLIFPRPTLRTCISSHSYLSYLLSGNYSRLFKDFVSLHLTKDPSAVSPPPKHEGYPS